MINTWPGWESVELLGEGSFGSVYRISRSEFGVTYQAALKVIPVPQNRSAVEYARAEGMDDASIAEYFNHIVSEFVREIALMSRLKGHSNIVSYEDHMLIPHADGMGQDILIRMELLMPLNRYMETHPLTDGDIAEIGADIANALKLCESKGILHRDIKPENIFVNEEDDYKLGDFGVARMSEKTISEMSKKGSYGYMAPEVYRGEKYGFSADIYSLGMVMYRLLNTNRIPFLPPAPAPVSYQMKENALRRRMDGERVPAPASGNEQLQKIILKCLEPDLKDRYKNADELARDLDALKRGEPLPSFEAQAGYSLDAGKPADLGSFEEVGRPANFGSFEEVRKPANLGSFDTPQQTGFGVVGQEEDEEEFEKTMSAWDTPAQNRFRGAAGAQPTGNASQPAGNSNSNAGNNGTYSYGQGQVQPNSNSGKKYVFPLVLGIVLIAAGLIFVVVTTGVSLLISALGAAILVAGIRTKKNEEENQRNGGNK